MIGRLIIYLFHGRASIDQDMTDWGAEGPKIGPLSYVHTTYGSDVKLRGAREVDAGGLLVLPGGVDSHVHVEQPGADGSMTGFGGGLPMKRWLLAHERSRGQQPLF